MKDYSKALAYFEKTLEICKTTLPEKHPNLAITYSNIGDVKRLTDDYSNALSFLRKALEILENVSFDRIYLALTYNYSFRSEITLTFHL
jgi:tetratricopeptide (TPR) repeat protein